MDDVAVHVDEVGGRGFHRGSEKRVAFEGFVSLVLGDTGGSVVNFNGLSGLGADKKRAGHETCSEEPAHEMLLAGRRPGKQHGGNTPVCRGVRHVLLPKGSIPLKGGTEP